MRTGFIHLAHGPAGSYVGFTKQVRSVLQYVFAF